MQNGEFGIESARIREPENQKVVSPLPVIMVMDSCSSASGSSGSSSGSIVVVVAMMVVAIGVVALATAPVVITTIKEIPPTLLVRAV